MLGKEVLGKSQRNGRCDPADFHDGHETGAHSGADLMESAGAGNDGHGDQIYRVLNRSNNQIANQDLQNLGFQTRATGKDLLQNSNENVAHGRTDEHSVQRHLWHAGAEVVAVLADIMSEPRGDEFLQRREDTGGEHLCAEGVCLELFEVGSKIAGMGVTASQTLADLVSQVLWRQVLWLNASGADSLLLEFDGHFVVFVQLSLNDRVEGIDD